MAHQQEPSSPFTIDVDENGSTAEYNPVRKPGSPVIEGLDESNSFDATDSQQSSFGEKGAERELTDELLVLYYTYCASGMLIFCLDTGYILKKFIQRSRSSIKQGI